MSAPMVDQNDTQFTGVKQALDYLVKGNEPTDDTLIHNFIDCLKLNASSADYIQSVGLHTFIEDVAKKWNQLNSSTVVFGLQVTSWLVENDEFYRRFNSSVHNVYSTLCVEAQARAITDVSILTAFFESLCSLTNCEDCMKLIASDSFAGVALEGVLLLTECSSIFLQKSVVKLLTQVIQQMEKLSTDEHVPGYMELYSNIIARNITNIKKHYSKKQSGPFTPGSVQLLESVCSQSKKMCNFLLTEHPEFCNYLIELIDTIEARDCSAVINILQALLNHRSYDGQCVEYMEVRSTFMDRVMKQLSKLATDGKIVKAQKLAASCLKTQCKLELQSLSLSLLIEPLDWLLGNTRKNSLFSEDSLQAAMSTRYKCTDCVCRSLEGQAQNLEICTLTEVLRRTSVLSGKLEEPYCKLESFLYKNRSIQRRCLEILVSEIYTKNGEKEQLLPLLEIIVELFAENDSDTVIYSLCSQLLMKWFASLFVDGRPTSLLASLAQTVQYHLSALQWELRDTTLELLGRIAETYTDMQYVVEWFVEYRLHVHVWQSLKDGESYVRASAITALYHICICPQLMSALCGTAVVNTEEDVIQTVVEIVGSDTEAFARRSAMTFLLNYFKVKVNMNVKGTDETNAIPDIVMTTIIAAARDFDWEVKLVVLDFIEFILHQKVTCQLKSKSVQIEIPEYARNLEAARLSLCNSVTGSEAITDRDNVKENGFDSQLVNSLFDTLDDYDEKVCEKALNVASKLQEFLGEIGGGSIKVETVNKSTQNVCADHIFGDERRLDFDSVNSCGAKKIKLDDRQAASETQGKAERCQSNKEEFEQQNNDKDTNIKEHIASDNNDKIKCVTCKESNSDSNVHRENGSGDIETVDRCSCMVKCILEFDLSPYKRKFERLHCDTERLASIVEDILSTGHEVDEEILIDCY